jgi:SAM-dependent methyltransferase
LLPVRSDATVIWTVEAELPAMADTDGLFSGSIPALYERYLAPVLFEPYALDFAARLAGLQTGRVLETAAGTGIVTRVLARTLPTAIEIVATDLNQAMLDFAATQPLAFNVRWQQADAQHLPFADQTFDAVVCQFGMMFLPNKRAGYAEAHRVLKPGGRFVFSVWDKLEENEFAHAVNVAVAALFPNDPPAFLARTPYGLHDMEGLREDLRHVGFSTVTIDQVRVCSRATSPRDVARGFCQGTPLRSEIAARNVGQLEEVTSIVASALASRFGPNPIEGKMKAHVVIAV